MHKKLLTYVALLPMVAGQVLAAGEVKVPNTKVSYILSYDPITDENESSIYIDEERTDNFVEFSCQAGKMSFFLVATTWLVTQEGYQTERTPKLTYRVDSQLPKTIPTVTLLKDDDTEANAHLMTLAVEDQNDPELFNAFKNAKTKVALRILRSDKRELTYIFPTKGFAQAWKGVRECR